MFLKFMSNVCRVCLGEEAIVSLFDGSGNDEKFRTTTRLEISENDGLPATLCRACFDSLNTAYQFFEQSNTSDHHLRSFVDSVNAKFVNEVSNLHRKPPDDDGEQDTQTESNVASQSTNTTDDQPHMTFKIEIVESVESDAPKETTEEDEVEEIESCEQIEENLVEDEVNEPEALASSDELTIVNESPDEHESIVTSPHLCNYCNKAYTLRANLVRHMLTHSDVKPFACTICHARFTQNGSLKQHMLRHTGERPFKCDVCPKDFTRRRLLVMHSRIHTGEKPYYCADCDLSFTVKEGLRRHNIRKHLQVQGPVYTCEICNRKLHSKYTFNNHMNIHNRNPTEQYTCKVCNKSLSSKYSLQSHQQIHLKDGVALCGECSSVEEQEKDEADQEWVAIE